MYPTLYFIVTNGKEVQRCRKTERAALYPASTSFKQEGERVPRVGCGR